MTLALFDIRKFLESLANDEELGRELVDAFLEDGPRRMAALTQALSVGDAAATSKLAHSLKGMCGVVRSDELSRLALEMEHLAREGRLDAVRERFARFEDLLARLMEEMARFMEDAGR